MKLCNCLHPLKFVHPVTGKLLVAPCGKCLKCQLNKAYKNKVLCDLEDDSHRFCLFVTLTYDDYHVPCVQMHYDVDIDVTTFEVIDKRISLDFVYIQGRYSIPNNIKLIDKNYIPFLYKKDLQDFLKRLRKNSHETFRYYACGEYGTRYFRPHFHLLLWCDSFETLSKLKENVSKSWKFGRIDASLSRGKTSGYCSNYVNSLSLSKGFHALKAFRQFTCHSKNLGKSFLEKNFKEILETSPSGFDGLVIGTSSRFVPFSVLNTYRNTLFPKCVGFSDKSFRERLETYTIYDKFSSLFKVYKITDLVDVYYNNYLSDSDFPADYVKSRLIQMFYFSKSFCKRCATLGVSASYYICKIQAFYHYVDKNSLKTSLAEKEKLYQNYEFYFDIDYFDHFEYGIYKLTSDYKELFDKSYSLYFQRTKTKNINDTLIKI